jgi:hypothetical protein
MVSRGPIAVMTALSAVIALGFVAARPTEPSVPAVVTVDAAVEVGTIDTRLGTQFVWPGTLERTAGAPARFNALAPALVRINATTIGARPVLPAGIARGDWSFEALDSMVGDIARAGSEVVLTVAYAPLWMWSCATGGVRDPTFGEFGDYMARLVAYFNTGSFVAEDGRAIVNPAGRANRIRYWELWNEPDLLDGCPPSGNRLTVSEYVAMWNGAVPKMLAVDPSIKLIGPATAHGATGNSPDYVQALMSGAGRKPDIVSFHGYGGWLNSQTDRFLFAGQGGSFGLDGIERALARIRAWAPGVPVWITEVGVNSAWEEEGSQRAWTAFGAAWGASAFRRLALGGAGAVYHYQFSHPDVRQFSLVDARTGDPLLPYWRDYYLARYFPPGSRVLSSSSNLNGVETLAVRPPGSANVNVLVINRQVDNVLAVAGPGRSATVQVMVKRLPDVSGVTVRLLDDTTPLGSGPAAISLGTGTSPTVRFSGYGAALLEFTARPSASGSDRSTLTRSTSSAQRSRSAILSLAWPSPNGLATRAIFS